MFEKLGCENLRCLYVFVKIDLEILTKLVVLEGFRHARAADARMWPAWYFLQGIVAPGRRANAVERERK